MRDCDHYRLGVLHVQQGLSLEVARDRGLSPQTRTTFMVHGEWTTYLSVGGGSCMCYLDGRFDTRDDVISDSDFHDPDCTCNMTLGIAIVPKTRP